LQILRSAAGEVGFKVETQDFRACVAWVISFSGNMFSFDFRKHLPGITNDACSGPGPLHRYVPCGPRLRCFWAIVPFDVGHDYAMWP